MNDIRFIVMLALLLLRLIGISISDNSMEQHDTVFGDDKWIACVMDVFAFKLDVWVSIVIWVYGPFEG